MKNYIGIITLAYISTLTGMQEEGLLVTTRDNQEMYVTRSAITGLKLFDQEKESVQKVAVPKLSKTQFSIFLKLFKRYKEIRSTLSISKTPFPSENTLIMWLIKSYKVAQQEKMFSALDKEKRKELFDQHFIAIVSGALVSAYYLGAPLEFKLLVSMYFIDTFKNTTPALHGLKQHKHDIMKDILSLYWKVLGAKVQDGKIDLSNKGIIELNGLGLIPRINQVRHLKLTGNNLTFFPKGVVEAMPQLDVLELNRNNISSIDTNAFDKAKKLEYLDLSSNRLTQLPPMLFYHLTQLKTLNLNANALTTLGAFIFERLKNLTNLDISQNKLEQLPQDLFNYMATPTKRTNALIRLNISFNKLSELPEAIFSGSLKLKKLALNNNKIATLPKEIFKSQRELQDLTLQNNELEELPDTIFTSLKKLEELNLANNKLISIPKGLFKELGMLKRLNLTDNVFKKVIKADRFKELPEGAQINIESGYLPKKLRSKLQ